MRKLRVLLLLHVANRSGAPKMVLDAFEQMTDAIELRTLTLYGGEQEARIRRLGRLTNVKYPALMAEAGGPLRRLAKVAWQGVALPLRLWKPDLIYVNSTAALPIARHLPLPDVPVLMHVHETGTLLEYHVSRYADTFRTRPARYLGVSRSVCAALTETHGIPSERVGLLYNFLSDEPGIDAPAASSARPLVVGGAGTPNWYKGTDLWLQMAVCLRDRLGPENVRFVWVGMNAREESLQFRAMARKLGIESLVEFLDATARPLEVYARFDVFAMTSWEESFSLVVLENMRLGKPVVCFGGSGGPPEVVGEAGIIVPEFSPSQMAKEIAGLAANAQERLRLGALARARACREFSAAAQIPKLRAEIERAAGRSV